MFQRQLEGNKKKSCYLKIELKTITNDDDDDDDG